VSLSLFTGRDECRKTSWVKEWGKKKKGLEKRRVE
jgi:hypothetical protein